MFEFCGLLVEADGSIREPSILSGTNLLPGLANKRWPTGGNSGTDTLSIAQQLHLKRARVRIEILKNESDEDTKFELFQRLNTGGSRLSEQEVRNCVMLMVNRDLYLWMDQLVKSPAFSNAVQITSTAQSQGRLMELALRFAAFRSVPYHPGLDVNEYLDDSVLKLAKLSAADRAREKEVFERCFSVLSSALGSRAFKKWTGKSHSGAFLISAYEVIVYGVSTNIAAIEKLPAPRRNRWVKDRVHELWSDTTFRKNSGMGVRGTTRLTNLLPFAINFFKP